MMRWLVICDGCRAEVAGEGVTDDEAAAVADDTSSRAGWTSVFTRDGRKDYCLACQRALREAGAGVGVGR
jgi:hypothetical protein